MPRIDRQPKTSVGQYSLRAYINIDRNILVNLLQLVEIHLALSKHLARKMGKNVLLYIKTTLFVLRTFFQKF